MKKDARLKHLGVIVPPALAQRVRRYAEDDHRSLSTYVRLLLEAHVKAREGQERAQ
jgi:hypothetical protein